MKTLSYEYILEKCGAEAFAAAIVVCLVSALVKNKFNLNRRIQTGIELTLSFAVTAIIALITKNGDLSGVIVDGLSTAGVALAVCGFVCGKSEGINADIFSEEKSNGERLKAIIKSVPNSGITEKEAELLAKFLDKLKSNSDKNT